ncbi:MAG TPA: methionyl-tRNA formyltransferase [Chloroflexota bacterium]
MQPQPPVATVFMGSERFSLPVLQALLADPSGTERRTRVVGVVTQPDRPAGRGQRMRSNQVKTAALEHGIPVLQPDRLRDPAAIEELLALQPELIVVASYGQLVPRTLLEAPRHGCLNLHPSLLPRYRGPSPIVGPILEGDSETGTSLMLMVPKMDAGPIIAQERVAIGSDETAGELGARLADLSAEMLLRELPAWLDGGLSAVDQREDEATYTSRVSKSDGEIEWQLPADEIVRRVHAYNPWPTAFTSWDGRLLKVLRAYAEPGDAPPGEVLVAEDDSIRIGTGNGLLVPEELQLSGGRPLRAEQIIRGYPGLDGAHLRAVA